MDAGERRERKLREERVESGMAAPQRDPHQRVKTQASKPPPPPLSPLAPLPPPQPLPLSGDGAAVPNVSPRKRREKIGVISSNAASLWPPNSSIALNRAEYCREQKYHLICN
jgi:hypothetical protein